MSRVTSSQSQGNTPGNATTLTPSAADRPPTRADSVEPARNRQLIESLKERHEEHRQLGGKLKRLRDELSRDRAGNMSAGDEKRAVALSFEMVLSFMVAFHCLNQARAQDRKVCDFASWESLIPHLRELKGRTQGNRPLRALAVQMHALCLEEITQAFSTLDPQSGVAATHIARWAKTERVRVPIWAEAMSLADGVEDRRLRTVVGPWTKVEDAVDSALGVLKRWAEKENVQWKGMLFGEGGKVGKKVNGSR
jgi:hypothetical protein